MNYSLLLLFFLVWYYNKKGSFADTFGSFWCFTSLFMEWKLELQRWKLKENDTLNANSKTTGQTFLLKAIINQENIGVNVQHLPTISSSDTQSSLARKNANFVWVFERLPLLQNYFLQ